MATDNEFELKEILNYIPEEEKDESHVNYQQEYKMKKPVCEQKET